MSESSKTKHHLKTFSADEPIVAMVEFQGTIYVASSFGVYKLIDDKFHQIQFVSQPHGMLVETKENVLQECPHGLLWDDCPDCRH